MPYVGEQAPIVEFRPPAGDIIFRKCKNREKKRENQRMELVDTLLITLDLLKMLTQILSWTMRVFNANWRVKCK